MKKTISMQLIFGVRNSLNKPVGLENVRNEANKTESQAIKLNFISAVLAFLWVFDPSYMVFNIGFKEMTILITILLISSVYNYSVILTELREKIEDMEKTIRAMLIVTGVKSSQILGGGIKETDKRKKEIETELGIEFLD